MRGGSNTGRECNSESEGPTQGGSMMVRVRENNTQRACDGEGVREQHGEGG